MGINEFVNAIIYSANKEFSKFKYIFVGENVRVVIQTTDISKVRSYLNLYKDAIVILDEELLGSDKFTFLNYLKIHKNGSVIFSNKNVSKDLLGYYDNIEILYINEYLEFEDVIVAISKKIRILNDKNNTSKRKEIRNILSKNMTSASCSGSEHIYDRYNENKKISKVVAIGASTGGPDSILKILKGMPKNIKYPILVVQHMPTVFTKMFANRINNSVDITVIEPKDGDQIFGGCAYIAPGGKQMTISESKGEYFIKILPLDTQNANNPSVDVLFNSIAECFGSKIVAVILTGMGKDGANGMLRIKNQGGYTIGQDENSSVVYGMPKAAYDIGAVQRQLDIDEISSAVVYEINKK